MQTRGIRWFRPTRIEVRDLGDVTGLDYRDWEPFVLDADPTAAVLEQDGSLDAYLAFVRAFGPLVAPELTGRRLLPTDDPLHPLRYAEDRDPTAALADGDGLGPDEEIVVPDPFLPLRFVEGSAPALALTLEQAEERVAAGGVRSELFERARSGIAAVGALRVLSDAASPERTADRWYPSALRDDWPSSCPWGIPAGRRQAERLLRRGLDLGLGYVSVRLEDDDGLLGLRADVRASLFGLALVGLTTAVLEARPYRPCANETCGRWFSITEEAARTGRSRPDLGLYHDAACRNAQNQRDWRRRRRRERRS